MARWLKSSPGPRSSQSDPATPPKPAEEEMERDLEGKVAREPDPGPTESKGQTTSLGEKPKERQ